jgi:proteic killer suppression protein
VIKTFADTATKKVFDTGKSENPPAKVLKRKFAVLDNAATLGDLANVPGNNFEKYQDHRKGQYSIRVNQKYRLFFRWQDGNANDVRLADEH